MRNVIDISEGMTCFLYLHVMIPIYTFGMLVYSTLHLLVTDILKEVKSHVLRFYLSELCGVIRSTKRFKKVINFGRVGSFRIDMILRMPIIIY